MTDSINSSVARASLKKALVLAIISICLLVAFISALENSTQIEISALLKAALLIPAVFLQGLALFLFVLAWFVLLNEQEAVSFSKQEVSAHIGVTLLGKYLPGKVWGFLGRAYMMTQRGMSSTSAAHVLLVDQFLTFYSGIAIGAVSLLALVDPYFALFLCLIILITTPALFNQYPKILSRIRGLTKKISARSDTENSQTELPIENSILIKVLTIYLFHWLATSLALCLLFANHIENDSLTNILLILAAIPLGVLGGFLALWAPGGIGIREGLIIMILSLNMDLETATSIAIAYRMICVLNDMVMGMTAMVFFSKHHVN